MDGDNSLPRQLKRRVGSHMEKRFDRSVEMVDKGSEGWHSHTSQTKDLLLELCPQYQSCSCSNGCVYCESGKHSLPFRGKACVDCIAGQVSPSLRWVGPEDEKSLVRSMTLKERYIASKVKPLTKI